VRVVADTLGSKASPSYSPDGRSIVFVAKSEANYDLYLIGRDGKGLTQLTNDAAVEGQPRFSPDGKSIVFHSNRTRHFQLYLMDLTRTPAMGELEDFFK
jgi:TolB protein